MSKRNRNTDRNTDHNTDRNPHRSAGHHPAPATAGPPGQTNHAVAAGSPGQKQTNRSAGNLPAKRTGLNPDRITNAVSATTYKPGFSHKGTERSRNATISDAMFQKELKAYREQQAKKYSKASE